MQAPLARTFEYEHPGPCTSVHGNSPISTAIYTKSLLKDNDMQMALQRLRELNNLESQALAVETRIEVSNMATRLLSEVQVSDIRKHRLRVKVLIHH